MNDRLYVGNLSWDADEESLKDAFSDHGEVLEARIIKDRETGRSRGFAFVRMASDEQATAAIEAMNGASFLGRELRVNVAEQRENRGPRRGPGGGGGGGYNNRDRDGGGYRNDRW